jgi:flagellar biosynthetic protein FlhB
VASDDAEKTEPATPKRRLDARKKGEVAQSREVVSVAILAGLLLAAMSALGVGLVGSIAFQAQVVWSGSEIVPSTTGDYHAVLLHHARQTGLVVGPLLLVIVLTGVAGNVIQTGPMLALEGLAFKWERISLINGAKRMFSLDRLFELLKAFVKLAVGLAAIWMVMRPAMETIMSLGNGEVIDALALASVLIRRLVILVLIGFGLFAALDLMYVRWRYEKKLRMSKQEVRDELRQREGDPKVRARARAVQRELSRMRMIAEVTRADVVVTNPTHYAVALRYRGETMAAPRVVAKGRNHLALRIRRVARQHGVPVVENPGLAQILYRTVPLGREIPERLYQAVAEVLAYITRLDPTRSGAWGVAS